MTNKTAQEINAEARQALKTADDAGGLKSVIYRDLKLVQLYDADGKYKYVLNLPKGIISYESTTEYPMDGATKKAVKRFLLKDIMPMIIFCSALLMLVAVGGIRANKTQKEAIQTEQNTSSVKDLQSVLVVDSIQATR